MSAVLRRKVQHVRFGPNETAAGRPVGFVDSFCAVVRCWFARLGFGETGLLVSGAYTPLCGELAVCFFMLDKRELMRAFLFCHINIAVSMQIY